MSNVDVTTHIIHVLLDSCRAYNATLLKHHFPSQHRFFAFNGEGEFIFRYPDFQLYHVDHFLVIIYLWLLFHRRISSKTGSKTSRCSCCSSDKSFHTNIGEAWGHTSNTNAEDVRKTKCIKGFEWKSYNFRLVNDLAWWRHDRNRQSMRENVDC